MIRMELPYVAGIVDGEGYVGINRHHGNSSIFARVQVTNTNKKLISALQKQFGGNITYYEGRNPNWKPQYIWRITNTRASDFLEKIYPFLIVKKRQAETIFEMQEMMPGSNTGKKWHKATMNRFVNRIKKLNDRKNYKGNGN